MPPVKGDSLSAATGASYLQRVPSSESLSAHPLLSSNSPSSSMPAQFKQDGSAATPPRYVPYTPRHRPPASSATISMTTNTPPPVVSYRNQEGSATSKLQFQRLKAAAQSIGLGTGTVGWAMLEKLVDGENGGEWDEIWTILTTAKPTLLLPLEPFSGELITPDLIKDHLAFCSGSTSSSFLITLSGLRGTISDSVLTFKSSVPPSSKQFLDLSKSDLQTPPLTSFPPLPLYVSKTITPLPSFVLPASTTLPLPRRSHASKPLLPPRPGISSSTLAKPQGGSRLTNPFASLFGRPPVSSGLSNLSAPPSQSTPHSEESIGSMDIPAFSLGKKITRKSVGKELSKVIKEEIKTGLAGCPTWVAHSVLNFTGALHPVPRSSRRPETSSTEKSENVHHRVVSTLPPSTQVPPDPSSISDSFQDFYTIIEDGLKASALGVPSSGRGQADRIVTQNQDDSNVSEEEQSEDSNDNSPRGQDEMTSMFEIREILEKVESVICTVFYDRTFRPLSGDDVSHDDALANRIAALSLLDLGLEHLGVEIPNETAKTGVDEVVKACGEILQQLEHPQNRSPKDKSALLIEAHKKIVDGLSRLPQLRLKPEHDLENHTHKVSRVSSSGKEATQEAQDVASMSLPTASADQKPNAVLGDVSVPMPPEPESTREPPNISAGSLSDVPAHDSKRGASGDGTSTSLTVGLPPGRSSPPPIPMHVYSQSPENDPASPTVVSGDLLFPLLIFSVVKANPAHLVSHLLYTQRFRSRSVGGQESYCLVNLMAVVEFLENVDMGALGLGDSERIMSTADLTPIPLTHGSIDPSTTSSSPLASRLGRRVNQQVGELAGLAGSANRVITGVVDSSFGVLRGFLTSNPDLTIHHNETQDSTPWNNMRPGFGLLRRGSGFSIASVAASLPGAGRPRTSAAGAGEEGQQMIEVSSRPGSIEGAGEEEKDDDVSTSSAETSESSPEGDVADRADVRSVRSFSSMLSRENRDHDGRERMKLTDRLANMSALSRLGTSSAEQQAMKPSPPPSRPASWLPPSTLTTQQSETPVSSGKSSPSHPRMRIPPPNRRFLECSEQDIRIGEIGELLQEYRRMVQALQLTGAFEGHL